MRIKNKRILITGGAGFIGVNLAEYFLKQNCPLTILDDFSRKGTLGNLKFLKQKKTDRLKVIKADIRDFKAVKKTVDNVDIVFHLAAQVAVTSSVLSPREDFEINALGSLNVLEAARLKKDKPICVFSSTNKVYGSMEDIPIKENARRYSLPEFKNGISESFPLDFHSPYGCSKGAADSYFRDYFRVFKVPTIVFRQSCIYGPRQLGVVDQGWVAYLAAQVHLGKKITIYGNGKQVRDLLHVSDLISAYNLAIQNITKSAGQIYNIGGGMQNSFSLLEYVDFLEKLSGQKIKVQFSDFRPGDQKLFVSDNTKLKKDLNWTPKITHKDGLKELFKWVGKNKNLFT